MVSIFDRLQVRYRSDRFSKVGGRWGAIPFDPEKQSELEKRRAALAEQRGSAEMNEALGKGFIRREVEALVEGRPPVHPTFGKPERR